MEKLGAQLLEQGAAEGGFARAHFAGELHKTLALANAIKQMVKRFAVLGADERGIADSALC